MVRLFQYFISLHQFFFVFHVTYFLRPVLSFSRIPCTCSLAVDIKCKYLFRSVSTEFPTNTTRARQISYVFCYSVVKRVAVFWENFIYILSIHSEAKLSQANCMGLSVQMWYLEWLFNSPLLSCQYIGFLCHFWVVVHFVGMETTKLTIVKFLSVCDIFWEPKFMGHRQKCAAWIALRK